MKTSSDLIKFLVKEMMARGATDFGFYEYDNPYDDRRYFEFDERELKNVLTRIFNDYDNTRT